MNDLNTPDRQLNDDYKDEEVCVSCGEYDELDFRNQCSQCSYEDRFEYEINDNWN